MGVYIKDIAKPENCDVCPVRLVYLTCGCDREHCMIQEAPPHTVEQKTGHWLDLDSCMTVCSECGGLGCESNYCPNCGAKMEAIERDSCKNCAYSYNLTQFNYTREGCKHTKMDGHICMSDAGERSAIWMIGEDDGMCECYQRRVG